MVDAFAEPASERRYIYSDYRITHEIMAGFSFIANITRVLFRHACPESS